MLSDSYKQRLYAVMEEIHDMRSSISCELDVRCEDCKYKVECSQFRIIAIAIHTILDA